MASSRERSTLIRWLDRFRPHLRPSFLIIGVQKAGTSALFRMFAQHPDVLAPTKKELVFFNRDEAYAKGLRHYWSMFPLRPLRGRKVTLEATPEYILEERAAERIKQALPRIKVIVILRDPVKRAFSAWNMFRDMKGKPLNGHLHDPRSFEQAVEDELSGADVPKHHRYLMRGHYAPQLRRYFTVFGRENVIVVDYRRFKKEPLTVFEDLCREVGLSPFRGDPLMLRVKENVRAYTAPLEVHVEQRLRTYYAPHIQELRQLLGDEWDLLEEGKA